MPIPFRAAAALASDLQIAPRHYKPPRVPFSVDDEGGWTQEAETDEWFRFLVNVGSTSLGSAMRDHFMRTLQSAHTIDITGSIPAARLPFERACAWRLFAEEHPEEFEDALPRHLGYTIRKLAAFVGARHSSEVQLLAGTSLDAVSLAIRSTKLRPNDRVLVKESMPVQLLRVVERECALAGAEVVHAPLPLKFCDGADMAAAIESHGLQECRAAVFEQSCTTTGLRIPLEVLDRCRALGVTTIVDSNGSQ